MEELCLQAKSILELRLQRLTALGKGELQEELKNLSNSINEYLSILRDKNKLQTVIKSELEMIKQEFSTPRKTELIEYEASDIDQEDLVQRSDMVISITNSGYIKRVPLEMYRAQKRGGKGRSGMKTNDEDFVTQVFTASTHDNMLFFSSSGIVYKLKTWKIPESSPTAKGKAIINLLNMKTELNNFLVRERHAGNHAIKRTPSAKLYHKTGLARVAKPFDSRCLRNCFALPCLLPACLEWWDWPSSLAFSDFFGSWPLFNRKSASPWSHSKQES